MFKLAFGEPCDCGACFVKHNVLVIGNFSVKYFREEGHWFLYVYTKTKFYRFSSAGFLKGIRVVK
jgi:hypothetical protein